MSTPFGSWASELGAAELTKGVIGFADLQSAADRLFLLESRPEEAGRNTLVMLNPTEPDGDGGVEVTPAPLNVRSRVHEYGGGAFLATEDAIYVVNFSDQDIYRIDLNPGAAGVVPGAPQQLTHSGARHRYADFALDTRCNRLIAVCEHHANEPGESPAEPENFLVAIDLADPPAGAVREEVVLHRGHDFYMGPRVSPDGRRLAFLVWDHPNMPWDTTAVYVAQLEVGGVAHSTQVAGTEGVSISQLYWRGPKELGYACDANGYWNPHRLEVDNLTQPRERAIVTEDAEYAAPAWVFGQRESLLLDADDLAAVRQRDGHVELVRLAPSDSEQILLHDQCADYRSLCQLDDLLYCIADRTDGFACLLEINPVEPSKSARIVRESGTLNLPALAQPEALVVENRDGLPVHAWFYPPCGHRGEHAESRSECPPLLVLSHGGPTSACSPALNLRIQYYTSRGWAVVDVNYGGSTGYGRAYRERLRGNWGITDVADCEDVARALAAQQRVDPMRMAIKGGSAGGYTTLAALTFGDVFAAGASHYGIGDLRALCDDTHKFEARYVDGLVPPTEIAARSPINSVDSLSCPVIFFQGADDAVVPPNQAQAMVAALDRKGLPVAYIEFAGEGHGFRQAVNIQTAAAAEYQFFCTIFGIQTPDTPIDLKIKNLP